MLYNPRSTERDNQNALRKYPFSDGATCTNGACVIPPGAIIDAQLYIPGREPGRVWLSKVDTDGVLRFSDANGEFAKLSQAPAANSAVQVTFTGDGGPLPGGVVVFGEEQDVSALRRLGGQSFTAAQAELAPAAVSWPGLPGVLGFRLDDGHVVYGDVKIRGENGCTVATYIDEEGDCRLRISAVGRKVEATTTTGFITSVVADSDNTNFTVKKDDASDYVIDIQPTGVTTMIDGMLNADQENMCSQVKTAVGTSSRVKTVEMAECEDGICASTNITRWKITLFDGNGNKVTWTADAEDSYITALTGGELSPLLSSQIPGNAVLPYDSRVAYVENSGAQYIDTGIKYRPSMSIRLKFTRVDMGTSGSVVLATTTTTPLIYLPALNNSSKTDRYVWRRPSVPEQSHTVTFADYPYSAEVYVDAQNDILYIDGIARKTGMIAGMNGYSSPYESASNIYLFSIAGSYWGHSQIYYLKIEENGVAIRDFIPVRKDGAGYMYDRVSRQLFGPQAGAAPLTYGDDVAAASSASLHNGLRFAGYYDDSGVMYYRYDGTPVRRFTADHDVALHAEYIAESSEATISFQDYGTLHLAAPSTTTYTNPLRIYGTESQIPTIREHSTKELTAGGAEALAEIILKPESPVGEIHIGIRGANKISML